MTTSNTQMVEGIKQAGILAAALIQMSADSDAATLAVLAPTAMRRVYSDRLAALTAITSSPFQRSKPDDMQRVAGQVGKVYSEIVSEALTALTLAVDMLAADKGCTPEKVVGLLVASAAGVVI